MIFVRNCRRNVVILAFILVLMYFATQYAFDNELKKELWQTIVPLDDRLFDSCRSGPYTSNTTEIALDMDLVLRMYSGKYHYYDHLLIVSMQYFWPGAISLVVVLDGENTADRELGQILPFKYPYPKVCFMEPIDTSIYHGRGHERMQRDFFYPEKYTKQKYVGFLDTDTVFVTKITKHLMFQNNKPIVIAQYGKPADMFWERMSNITEGMLKSREIMRCMSYFPMIMKVDHIVELRKYLETLHGQHFDHLYKTFSLEGFSQFNIFCQYIWMFHRKDYEFRFQLRPYEQEYYKKSQRNSNFRKNVEYFEQILTPAATKPLPRTSIHYRYYPDWIKHETLRQILKTGICFSGGFEVCPDKCNQIDRNWLHKDLFIFEDTDWTWDNRCHDEQLLHYQFVKNIKLKTYKSIVEGCTDAEKLTVPVNEPA